VSYELGAGRRVIAGLCLSLGVGAAGYAQTPSPVAAPVQKGAVMPTRAKGEFDVKLTPLGTDDKSDAAPVGSMSISKQLHGDLEGTSKGQMLTATTDVKGSAVYVAIERITGTLHGRKGSFLLHHTGVMTRGAPHLTVSVVPDSGTGQLTGITGRMEIIIADGNHSYDFEYTLAPAP
jgi:hypothetical protein